MNEPPVEEYKEVRSDEKTVSQCLSAAREAMGLSQKEIAKALNLTESFVQYLDEGQFEKFRDQPLSRVISGLMQNRKVAR